jgi:hypothetical protein
MQGVEILTSAQVVTEWASNWIVFWVVFLIMFGIGLFFGIKFTIAEDDWTPMVACILVSIIVGCLFGLWGGEIFRGVASYETQYKVTISDEVSMTEFYEHYEVIEQDGKIFTVKEKTNESN